MDKRIRDIDLYKNYLNWSQNAGAFRCFFRTTNFVSLKHYQDFLLNDISADEAVLTKIKKIAEGFSPKSTLFMIDLPGELAIAAAFMLREQKYLNPILTFNNVLHTFGLIGAKQYISNLLIGGEQMENSRDCRGYVFVLDQQRYGDYDDDTLRKYFNNQYELSEEDLPSGEMLRGLNYDTVVYINQGGIKEDIENYLSYLHENGFRVIKKMI